MRKHWKIYKRDDKRVFNLHGDFIGTEQELKALENAMRKGVKSKTFLQSISCEGCDKCLSLN